MTATGRQQDLDDSTSSPWKSNNTLNKDFDTIKQQHNNIFPKGK